MTNSLIFMPAARLEVMEAQDWYKKEESGLGAQFRAETDHQIARIMKHPLHFPRMLADVHRAKLRRFPYSLFFRSLQTATPLSGRAELKMNIREATTLLVKCMLSWTCRDSLISWSGQLVSG